MQTRQPCFSPGVTRALKGIAILFMFTHHFFTFPGWYVEGVEYPDMILFAYHFSDPLKICVPVFAFLTGYLYFFRPQSTYCYTLRKVSGLYARYWMVYLPLLAVALALGQFSPCVTDVLLEALALKTPVMFFGWYVRFYAIVMLLLPAARYLPKSGWGALAGVMAPCIAILWLQTRLHGEISGAVLYDLEHWLPVVTVGYLAARHRLFERLHASLPVCALLAAAAFVGRFLCPSASLGALLLRRGRMEITLTMDVLYAPCFVYGTTRLLQALEARTHRVAALVMNGLEALGRKSLWMWLVHCVFFGVSKEVFQPVLYWPREPILVLLWGLVLCYLAACALEWLARRILPQRAS